VLFRLYLRQTGLKRKIYRNLFVTKNAKALEFPRSFAIKLKFRKAQRLNFTALRIL